MTITYDAKIAARVAFSHRRHELLTSWLNAPATDRTFWTERLMLLADAEIAIFGMLLDAEITAWEESRRRERRPSSSQLMDALHASLAGGRR